ncbi:MAG: ATP synthase F1 subunit epsilon [Hyphomonadaceae bacterium]|nr:ATP synthase F1 subunit epsilon [Clostridia bacterium]
MSATFHLEILTAERVFFTGHVEMVTLPAISGDMGILQGHQEMVTAVTIGEIRIKTPEGERCATISDGFVEIMPDYVIILADSCEWPEEIDVKRALAAKERSEEVLRQKKSRLEYLTHQTAMRRALARLKVTKELR